MQKQLDQPDSAMEQTWSHLGSGQPIFEAGFSANGVSVFADVLLPDPNLQGSWKMLEVKSSTRIKDHHRLDAAIQAHIAKRSGLPLTGLALAHIDNTFTYEGDGKYAGLLKENDMTLALSVSDADIEHLIEGAKVIAEAPEEPALSTGKHCNSPNECGFLKYCQSQESRATAPATWIPRRQKKALVDLVENASIDMEDIPDELLNKRQLRVKRCTLNGEIYADFETARADLPDVGTAAFFMDFETVAPAVPLWKGTRPYQPICFQFSVHEWRPSEDLIHHEFLDLTGDDPSYRFAEALMDVLGAEGPIFVYNASFERARIRELADRFTDLQSGLLGVNERIFDLFPVAQNHYYHPDQQGSWSLKKVLPTIAPHLAYADLEGVQEGTAAMLAFEEAISSETSDDRKDQIRQQLLGYCELDTLALVEIWRFFATPNQAE